MNTRLRKEIEWHFYNYEADRRIEEGEVREIAEAGITTDYRSNIRAANDSSNLTENKALLLCGRRKQSSWAAVVENTIITFEGELQADIIRDKFCNKLRYHQLVEKYGSGNRSVYDYRYEKIINRAVFWAQKFNLIRCKSFPF